MKFLRYIFLLIFLILSSCLYDTIIDTDLKLEEISYRANNYNSYSPADLFVLSPTHHIPVLKNMYSVSDSIITMAHYDNNIIDNYVIKESDSINYKNQWWSIIYHNNFNIEYNHRINFCLDLKSDTTQLIYLDFNNILLRKNDTTFIKTELVHEITFDAKVEPWHESNIDL